MKYEELRGRIHAELEHPEYGVNWYSAVGVSDARFTIVPLASGRFTLYHSDGRGQYYQATDSQDRRLEFENEDAVCDYVWEQLTAYVPRQLSGPAPSAEARRASLERQNRRVRERLERASDA
jgi:hypothetical protein